MKNREKRFSEFGNTLYYVGVKLQVVAEMALIAVWPIGVGRISSREGMGGGRRPGKSGAGGPAGPPASPGADPVVWPWERGREDGMGWRVMGVFDSPPPPPGLNTYIVTAPIIRLGGCAKEMLALGGELKKIWNIIFEKQRHKIQGAQERLFLRDSFLGWWDVK